VELDPDLVAESRKAAEVAGVGNLVRFQHADRFETDFCEAEVVALYLLPEMTKRLVPKFERHKPGSRLVAHAFAIPGLKSDRVETVTSAEDGFERKLYRYTVPLKKE
jgi:hypothetical protein